MQTSLPGRAWLSIPKFESHLYAELDLSKEDSITSVSDGVRFYNGIVYKEGVTKQIFWAKLEMQEISIHNSKCSNGHFYIVR